MMQGRDDRGAVAIMVAVMAMLLLSLAALGVDLGNAYVQKNDVQKLTDFAALAGAGGNNLPGVSTTTCPYGRRASATDPAVQDVAAYLGSTPWSGGPSAAELVDCSVGNGEVFYGTVTRSAVNASGVVLSFDANKLSVISPQRQVDFGFARVMGFDSTRVSGQATAEVRSPTISSVPFYAFTGCDYGLQTIANPNNGHAVNGVLLSHGTDNNTASLTAIATDPPTSPPSVPYPAPDPSRVVITGTGLSGVDAVGFFESGSTSPGPEPVMLGTGDFTVDSGTKITVPNLPLGVRNVQDTWYVRVRIGGQWSKVADNQGDLKALPLVVGVPTLTCGQGSSEGNFGTLLLANDGVSGQWQQIALNIATTLQHALAVYPTPASDWTCSSNDTHAVLWPRDGTNCVDTKTGMAANAAQAGFVDGIAGKPGRLAHVEAGTGCAADGTPATTVVDSRTINNDTLSCFFTDDTTNVGMVDSMAYSLPGPVFSPRIYMSPRFVMTPVLGRQPASGGSAKYQIVGFRPGFITDQLNSATRATPATAGNGLSASANGALQSVQVVFINPDALPPMESTQTTTYAGSGPRVVQLVN